MRSHTHAVARLAAIIVLASSTIGAQSAPRPIQHEDIWTLRRLGAPAIDRQGTFAILPVTEPSYAKDGTKTDLWWVPLDGSKAVRRLTSAAAAESSPAISPDGRFVAFTAKREGDSASQIYLLPLDGPGEARRITELPTGASGPVWSPDGRALAFTSSLYPKVDASAAAQQAEAERRKKDEVKVSAYESFPVRHWDRWRDDRKVQPFVLALSAGGEPDGAPRALLAGTDILAGDGYRGSGAPTWTPDGRGLIYGIVTNGDQGAHATTPTHLYRVPAAGGVPRRITPDGASWSQPMFSSDGKTLYARRTLESDWVYNLPHLVKTAWKDSEMLDYRAVAADLDRPVNTAAPIAGSNRIAGVVTDSARHRIVVMGDQAAVPLVKNGRGTHSGFAAAHAAPIGVSVYEDSGRAAELVATDLASGRTTTLTAFNAGRLDGVQVQPFEEFWFESSKGRRIHCWVALPPGMKQGERYPMLMWMHGGPHSSSMDKGHVRWDMRLLAAPGYIVVAPDYSGSIGYGEDFARAIQGDPLATPCQEIVEAADAALARYPAADPKRLAALGASYGGHMANWMQAKHGDRFRCLVGHAGLASLEGQWGTSDAIHHRERNLGGPPWAGNPTWQTQSPHSFAADFATPMLLTIGEKDYRVPLNQTLHMWSMLQRQQVPSRLLVYHAANHWIMRGPDAKHFWGEVHKWLGRWLRP